MLADEVVKVAMLRVRDEPTQKQSPKWTRALKTVDWLTSQLPVGAKFQVITFNTEAKPILDGTEGQWLEVADTPKLEAISEALREQLPSGGTSLHNAFSAVAALPDPPDNIFLLTDGLPTQGPRPPRKSTASGAERLELFRKAIRLLPKERREYDPFLGAIRWLRRSTGNSPAPQMAASCHRLRTGLRARRCQHVRPAEFSLSFWT